MSVRRHGDHQQVVHFCLLQVANVINVNEVKHTVAVDDCFLLGTEPGGNRGQLVDVLDFICNSMGHSLRIRFFTSISLQIQAVGC